LRSPFSSMLALDGISHNGSIAYTSSEQARIFQQHFRDIDVDLGKQRVSQHVSHISLSGVPSLSVDSMMEAIRVARRSAPGLDGFPFPSWKSSGLLGVEIFIAVQQCVFCGCCPPSWFNCSRRGKRKGTCSKLKLTRLS
jgi:hypothetical protein